MVPAIFLDRDGVLIENRPEYVRDWSQVNVFPEAIQALSSPKLDDYRMVMVTNQSAVGRGIISLAAAEGINERLIGLIRERGGRIDSVYLCPHSPEDGCNCRKPKPGLLLRAAKELSLDLKRSWMIGDAWSDVRAGQTAGVRGTIILKTGRGTDQLSMPEPTGLDEFMVCDDLPQALSTILALDGRE